jgi:hypothetical protein
VSAAHRPRDAPARAIASPKLAGAWPSCASSCAAARWRQQARGRGGAARRKTKDIASAKLRARVWLAAKRSGRRQRRAAPARPRARVRCAAAAAHAPGAGWRPPSRPAAPTDDERDDEKLDGGRRRDKRAPP